ncbi:MAG: protein PhnA [Saprospiraceae bacterium]|jgi:protein PhnA
MNIESELAKRSNGVCELCASNGSLAGYEVEPSASRGGDDYVHACNTCLDQLNENSPVDANHWRCLNDAMWSEVEAVKVVSYRMLHQLSSAGWPANLIEMMYLEESTLKWAKAGMLAEGEIAVTHLDSNGAKLKAGDNVVLIKDLVVKGGNFTAKRGTAVRGISLVHDNANHIEGKADGQHIVILTEFVKKM